MDQPPDAIEKESPTQFEFYSCSFQLSFVVTLGEIYQLSSVTCDFDSSSSDPICCSACSLHSSCSVLCAQ